jgi:hypothetical protein
MHGTRHHYSIVVVCTMAVSGCHIDLEVKGTVHGAKAQAITKVLWACISRLLPKRHVKARQSTDQVYAHAILLV